MPKASGADLKAAQEFRVVRPGQSPQRWDRPFDADMTEGDVLSVLARPPFSDMDPAAFPASCSLRDLLRNDARIRRYRTGDIVVRRGDYGNSAFLVLEGAVRVDLDVDVPLPEEALGRSTARRTSWGEALAKLWRNPREPEVRSASPYASGPATGSRVDAATGTVHVFLQDVPGVIERYKTVRLGAGEFFGETAALGRVPRTATVFADGDTELLEIRWQGLRDIMRRDAALQRHINRIYRDRNLVTHLLETPIFAHLQHRGAAPDCACERCAAMREIVAATKFSTIGDFDWYTSYQRMTEADAATRLAREPLIVEEGHYLNALLMVRSGFVRVTRRHDHGERTVSYLARGHSYGLREIVHNWRHDDDVGLQHTLRAVGYAAVLFVPTAMVVKHVLGPDPSRPIVSPLLLPPDTPHAFSRPGAGADDHALGEGPDPDGLGDELLEFMVERRTINGTAAMVIRIDRCVQCDDCVRACATTHDNNPRFIRHGPRIGDVMIANACMHCADPVCMIGCPTGAIHRDPFGGQVQINDLSCIGCGTCSASCPYDNIRMVPIRDTASEFIREASTGEPLQKATKCDLCAGLPGGPACARACPHDALRRIDLHHDLGALADWLRE